MQVDLFGGCFSVSGHGNLKENGQKKLLLSSGNIRKPTYRGHGCRRVKSVARGMPGRFFGLGFVPAPSLTLHEVAST